MNELLISIAVIVVFLLGAWVEHGFQTGRWRRL